MATPIPVLAQSSASSGASSSTTTTIVPFSIEPPPVPKAQKGCCCGRSCQKLHPIYGCSGAGMLLDVALLIGGIVGGILMKTMETWLPTVSYCIGGIGGFLIVKDGCQTLYLCSWRPKKTLEQAVEATTQASQQVGQRIQELEAQIHALQATKTSLEGSLNTERQRAEGLSQTLRAHDLDLEKLGGQVRALQESLDKTSQLKEQWQRIAQQASTEIASFHQSVQKFTSQDVESAVVTLHALSHEADADSEEARVLVTNLNKARMGWIEILQKLYQGFQELRVDVEMKARTLTEQQHVVDTLRGANTKLEEGARELQPLLQQFSTLTKQYETARGNFEKVLHHLEIIRDLPEGSTIQAVHAAALEAIKILKTV